MRTESVAIARLVAPERNSRKHPAAQIRELCRALIMFGQTRPVVVDESDVVLAGNGLVEAMRQLAWPDCVVYRLAGLTPEQKTKLMLSDNKIYDLGVDDYDAIADMLRGIADFDVPGFDAKFLQDISASLASLTASQLNDYGSIPVDAPRGRDIPPGSQDAPMIECPACGHRFAS